MSLPASERAKHYREKKKDDVRNSDNLYRKIQRLTMKVMDSSKYTERLKKQRAAKGAYRKTKRGEIEASVSQSPSTSTAESSQSSLTESSAILRYNELAENYQVNESSKAYKGITSITKKKGRNC